MQLELTLPGGGILGGGGQPAAPAAPAAPPPPPSQVEASRQIAQRGRARRAAAGAENIRNEGGGRGLDTANTTRALKTLTGQ